MDQQTLQGASAQVSVAPAPAWVDLSPYEAPATIDPGFAAGGRALLLNDTQVDLTGPERVWYCRNAVRVTAGAGAEAAAQFSIAFDPSSERVEVHAVCVRRGAETFDYAQRERFEIFRRERKLESQVFDGLHTIHAVLPDVRAGDVVETEYSLIGMRPSQRNMHTAWITFEWSVGALDVRHRMRTPEGRAVSFKAFNDPPAPVATRENGIVDQRWRVVRRPGKDAEPIAPPGTIQFADLQFSEWPSWAAVVAAFAPAYADAAPLPDDLAAEADGIAAANPKAGDRAAALLRFVQERIRYLAVSIGDGGLIPRPVTAIWANRYGDCKDAAKLYCALARRVGLDACPALVNTIDRDGIAQWLPSSAAFDHCIVRVRIDGKSHWLDPTRSPQQGDLERIVQAHFGAALPLADGVDALEPIAPRAPIEELDVREVIHLGATPHAPARYEWRTILRGGRADAMRDWIARDGESAIFKRYSEDVRRAFPAARQMRQEIVRDDIALNEIELAESYDIPDAWKPIDERASQFASYDLFLKDTLAPLPPGERRCPIFMGAPMRAARRVVISTAIDWDVTPWDRVTENAAATYSTRLVAHGRRDFELEQALEIRAEILPADAAAQYRELVDELHRSDVVFTGRTAGGKFLDLNAPQPWGLWDIARAIMLGFVIVYALYQIVTSS